MSDNEGTYGYASTERDTDISAIDFLPWRELADAAPTSLRTPSWSLGRASDLTEGIRPGAEVPLFAFVRILGTDYILSTYQSQSCFDSDPEWRCDVQSRICGYNIGSCETRDEACEKLRAYAMDVLADEAAVIACLNKTDMEFVRQAKEAGATVCFENNRSERDKEIEIEIRGDLSTDEHPFSQGFRISAYARPEGCHWGCWYYFAGLDVPYGRQRGIEVNARKGFSVARIVDDASRCDGCGRHVPVDELITVGFANASCPDCKESLKKKLQPRGWCD